MESPTSAGDRAAGSGGDAAALAGLQAGLSGCMARDGRRLAGRVLKASERLAEGRPIDRMLRSLRGELAASVARAEARRQRVPAVTYPEALPVSGRREAIVAAVADHPVVVVCGATGSGKTTQLPKMCLDAVGAGGVASGGLGGMASGGLGRGVRGMIGHTQPRRLATRAVASRIAEELGVPLGREVGFKVRSVDQTGPETLVKVMTDGILLAELASDRDLLAYDTLIIDEAHERSLNIDFLLGYLRRLLPRRPDLKLIITSATIDPRRFAEHFKGVGHTADGSPARVPIIDVEGRTYPVEVRYRPIGESLETETDAESDAERGSVSAGSPGAETLGLSSAEERRDVATAIGEALDELRSADRGDVLVFLPGEREIREVAEYLAAPGVLSGEADILPLYARLPTAKQQLIFHPDGRRRRVILATNVAETSLTVPGIRHVIDTGVARISRYSARSRVQRLPIERISQASAEQRKGRCGRVAPGVCIRLYSEGDYTSRPEHTDPEVHRTSLAAVVLRMADLGLGDPTDFPFVDAPPGRMLSDGYRTLFELRAIDEQRRLTDLGRRLARMPVDPRIGRMILEADAENCLRETLVIAAALSIQDPRVRPGDQQQQADEKHKAWFTGESDFLGFWQLWRWYRKLKGKLSRNQLRKACGQNFLAFQRMREWEELHRQLRDAAADAGMHMGSHEALPDAVHRSLLAGLLNHVGKRGDRHEYQGPHARKFSIFPGSALFRVKPRWIMAAQLIETSRLYAHLVAPIQPGWIEPLAPHLITRHHTNPRFEPASGRIMADERVSMGGLTITPKRGVHYGPIKPREARELFIRVGLVEGEYRTRGSFARHNRRLIEEVRDLEAKQRRGGLLAESDVMFDFYDALLPPEVYSGSRFEKWRRDAEASNPAVLCMSREMLLAGSADHITAESHPDRVAVFGERLKLQYKADPRDEDDGVTMTVPLGQLPMLTEPEVDWLVPGMLEEKVTALMRTLPKALRTRFVPLPSFVAAIMPRLEGRRGEPLLDALTDTIGKATGVHIPLHDWHPENLPAYLRMNIAVVDDAGKLIAQGRDLTALKARLQREVEAAIEEATRRGAAGGGVGGAADADGEGPGKGGGEARGGGGRGRRSEAAGWTGSGLTAWSFGPLPETIRLRAGGMSVHGFAGIVDEGESVALRVFQDAVEARRRTRAGVRRLFALRVAGELKYIRRLLSDLDRLALQYATLMPRDQLVRDICDAAVDRVFLEGLPEVRDAEAFDLRHQQRGGHLEAAVKQAHQLAWQVIEQYNAVRGALDGSGQSPAAWGPAIRDIEDQLARLMAAGFLFDTPWPWLMHYPRYLRGIGRRLERLRGGKATQDAQKLAELRPFWLAWVGSTAPAGREGEEAVRQYRWMLEEYRVSLFAPGLPTQFKVSPKRLTEQARAAGLMARR